MTNRVRFGFTAWALIGLVLIGLAGCAPPSQPQSQARRLVVGATAQPPTLDANTNAAAAIPQLTLYNVYQTLVKLDANGLIVPSLATHWEVSADLRTYTFTMDPTATFAGGRPVTAEDVVWNIKRVQSSGVNRTQMAPVATMAAAGDHTLTVTLKNPSNMWLFNMTQSVGMVYDPDRPDFATATAGSGPYQITDWAPGTDAVLRLRADYSGPKPAYDTITFRYFSDPNAGNAAMLSGGLDILSSLQAPQAIDQFADPARFTIIDGTTNGEVVMSFNHQTKPLQDKRVRQAINYAIDRQALLNTVWNGKGTLIGSMVPPTDPWFSDLSHTYPYDPAKARQLLADAGYQPGQLSLRLRLPALPYATASGQFVTSALRDIGINAVVDELEYARWLEVVYKQADYDMSIIAHVEPRDIVKYADPKYYWRYNNPQVQKLIAQADEGTDQEQVEKLRQVAKIIADDAAADWLFLLPNLVITRPGIAGVPTNVTGLAFDLTAVTSQ